MRVLMEQRVANDLCAICEEPGRDCEIHFLGWTEDGKTITREHDKVVGTVQAGDVLVNTGVSCRVYRDQGARS